MNVGTELEPARPRAKSRAIYWVLSIAFAAVLLYFSLKGIEWRRVGELIGSAKPSYVGLVCLLVSLALLLRAMRWRVLLEAEGAVSMATSFWATSAGYFGNNFLPARAGELVRTFMISAGSKLSKTFVLTTALSERVADAIVLVTISAGVLLTMDSSRPGWLGDAARPFAALGLAGRGEAHEVRRLVIEFPPRGFDKQIFSRSQRSCRAPPKRAMRIIALCIGGSVCRSLTRLCASFRCGRLRLH